MTSKLFALINMLLFQDVEMADSMRADGKIWVVVAVIATTFAGIIVYLLMMERSVSKLEKKLNLKK